MADLRFSVPNAQDFDPRVWETAYITGIEGIPWFCRHTLRGNDFRIGREIDESGKLHIVWPSHTLGNVCLSTTSLRVSEDIYSLPVELARGTVNRLKNQTAEWQRVGLRLPSDYFSLAEESLTELLQALTAKRDSRSQVQAANLSIDLALQAAVQLCASFSHQALETRRSNEGKLATLLGCQLDMGIEHSKMKQPLESAFNMIGIPVDFGQLESTEERRRKFEFFDPQVNWVTGSEKKLCIGPMVDLRDGRLPDWITLLGEGFANTQRAACEHVEKTVQRYRGKAHLWNCAAGLNAPNKLGWSDEEVLRLAVSLIETVRKCDDRSPVLLSIDQPWSEYLRHDNNGISPLHFADALIRADLGLSGLALELNFDLWPGGSMMRDPIEINRLIDRWSMLGLPLMVVVSSPTDNGVSKSDRRVCNWKSVHSSGGLEAESIVRLLLAKPSVHAIMWQGLADHEQAANPGFGLWDARGEVKPLLESMKRLRATYLH